MIDPALGGGSLMDMGPYPAVWATMLLHHHPANAQKAGPTMPFSHQTIYERSGVDSNSRWLLDWEGLGQAMCVTDMSAHGTYVGCVVVTCSEGDLIVEGEYSCESYRSDKLNHQALSLGLIPFTRPSEEKMDHQPMIFVRRIIRLSPKELECATKRTKCIDA
jgi:predicted dehydrogenase